MNATTYRKLIVKQLNPDFKFAVEVVEIPISQPAGSQLLIQNKFAGVNGGFDTLLCRGNVPYIN